MTESRDTKLVRYVAWTFLAISFVAGVIAGVVSLGLYLWKRMP